MTLLDVPADWRLKETLEREGVSVYALAKKMGGDSRKPALYAITSPDLEKRPRRVTFQMLEEVAGALYDLTGKRYAVGDLIEFVPDDAMSGSSLPMPIEGRK